VIDLLFASCGVEPEVCRDAERARARDAARRIEALGANRGKPLVATLERLLAGA
jgi:hypothetical protein